MKLNYVRNIYCIIFSYLIFQLTLGLIGSLMGVVSLIGLAVNANSIGDLSTDQDSICTAVCIDLSCTYILIRSIKIFSLYVVMTSFIKFFRLKTLEIRHLLYSLLQLKLIQMLKEWQKSTKSLPKSTAIQLQIVKLSRSNHFCLTQS